MYASERLSKLDRGTRLIAERRINDILFELEINQMNLPHPTSSSSWQANTKARASTGFLNNLQNYQPMYRYWNYPLFQKLYLIVAISYSNSMINMVFHGEQYNTKLQCSNNVINHGQNQCYFSKMRYFPLFTYNKCNTFNHNPVNLITWD